MFFLTFSLSVQAAAVPIEMPILPYIPPNDSQIMDLISNAYGVTAPEIEDAEEKMQAYLKIYQGILGTSYDTFKDKLDTIIGNAKTSGQIKIDSSASTTIQQALNQAVQNGYNYGTQLPNATSPAEWVSRLQAHGITMTLAQATELKSLIDASGWYGNQSPYTLGVDVGENQIQFMPYYINTSPKPHFVPHPNVAGYYMFEVTISNSYKPNVSPVYVYNINMNTLVVGTYNRTFSGGNALKVEQGLMFTLGSTNGETATVQAQNQSIADAITTQEVIPVTANTDTSNMSGDIVINIPSIIIYPAETVNDLPTTQEQLGVIPTTPDTTAQQLEQIISELKALKTAELGDIPTYSIDLTEYFPFCIPFDIGNILTILIAEPEAPSFNWDFPSGYQNGEVQYTTVTIDLSVWDPVAAVLRAGLVLVFIIGLGMITRSVFLRG